MERNINKTNKNLDMPFTEEYLSLSFLAIASLGVVLISPFFIEAILIFSVVLIILWKKIYDKLLTKLKIEDYATSLILCSIVVIGIFYLLKGSFIFSLLGIIYLISTIFGFKTHLELIYKKETGG
jgi:hypothetical protein